MIPPFGPRTGPRRASAPRAAAALTGAVLLVALVGLPGATRGQDAAPPAPGDAPPAAEAKAEGDAKAGGDAIVAVVDGRALTREAFAEYLIRMIGPSYIDIFINEALVEGEAKRLGVAATPALEAAWIEDKIERVKTSPEYRATLGQGYDFDELRRQYRPHARMGYLLETLIRGARSGDAAIQREYERRHGARVKARHILYAVAAPADADEATKQALDREARAKADRARDLLAKGLEFEELARRESEDPGSARRGGLLPVFGRGEMVPAFEEAAFALKLRELSAPVRSPFGWHVIQVLEVFAPAKALDAAMREEIARELARRPVDQEELARYLESLRAKAKIEVRFP